MEQFMLEIDGVHRRYYNERADAVAVAAQLISAHATLAGYYGGSYQTPDIRVYRMPAGETYPYPNAEQIALQAWKIVNAEGWSWHSECGWVEGEDFDVYSPREKVQLNLPIGGRWEVVNYE